MKVNQKSIFSKSVSVYVLSCIDIIRRWLEGVAIRRVLAVVLIGLLSFVGSSMVGALSGLPKPSVHDEFSYLLAADTFAKGRLSNPTHPMWVHFESFHINHQPTYMSKYPPAQGLILAVGQIIGGHPIWGVWISTALMCAAICWMLYGWIPPKWAFLGGLLTVIQLGIMTYWSQSYWGGAVAASGGALVFGALRRIIRRQYARDALLMGLGLAVLANSRPWEGMVASIPVFVMLFFWMFGKNHLPFRKSFTKIILPISFILILTATGMGVYNHAVTGNALRMPYSVNEETYSIVPIFAWQERGPEPNFRHKIMQKFDNEYVMRMYLKKKSLRGFFGSMLDVAIRIRAFYFYGLLTIPMIMIMIMIMLPWILQNRWMRFALITVIIFVALANSPIPDNVMPHYLAPIASLFILFVAQCLRFMHLLRFHRKSIGKIIVLVFLSVFIMQKVYPVAKMFDLKYLKKDRGSYFQYSIAPSEVWIIKGSEYDWASKRVEIIKEFKKVGGRHLIIVRYGPNHTFHNEWVYNEADIDNASVVWAREMDMNQNRKLLEYFKDRTAWLLKVDKDNSPPELLEYPDIDAAKNK